MLRQLYYALPIKWRYIVRRLLFLPLDIFRKDKSIPPRGMIYTGGGDFKAAGNRIVDLFIEEGGLKPSDDVLDIGSGIGRIAIPLTKFITSNGSYRGFDLVKMGVDWCRENISSNYSNFEFLHVKLNNDLYTSESDSAQEFKFPYPDNSYDFVCLISVFTHMKRDEISHYLAEILRCLRTGGRCIFSCFSYATVIELSSNNNFKFGHIYEDYALMNKKVTAANIALKHNWWKDQISANQFRIVSFFKGSWQHEIQSDEKDFQDIFIIEKI